MADLNTAYFSSLTNQINSATSCAQLQAAVTRAFTSINAFQSAITTQQEILAVLQTLVAALTALGSSPVTGAVLLPFFQQMFTTYATYAAKASALVGEISSLESAITTAAAKFPGCEISIP